MGSFSNCIASALGISEFPSWKTIQNDGYCVQLWKVWQGGVWASRRVGNAWSSDYCQSTDFCKVAAPHDKTVVVSGSLRTLSKKLTY